MIDRSGHRRYNGPRGDAPRLALDPFGGEVKSGFNNTLPPDWFTPPGVVKVSAAALELARAFLAEARRTRPDEDWIVTFDWADSRRVRLPDNQWEELGEGVDLAVDERAKIPPDVTTTVGGVEFAVKVGDHIYARARQRLIDRDDTVRSRLVLR